MQALNGDHTYIAARILSDNLKGGLQKQNNRDRMNAYIQNRSG